MYCNECGALNPDGAKFCNACGTQMHVVVKPVERTESAPFYKTYDELSEFGAGSAPSAEESSPVVEETAEVKVSAVVTEKKEFPVVEPLPVEPVPVEKQDVAVKTENPLEKLSTYSQFSVIDEKKVASPSLDPIEDDYWDDTLKEIDSEIYAIPKENIIKIAGSIIALLLVIFWFIYML